MIPKFRFWYEREDFYPDENYMRDVWGIEYITDSKIKLNDDYIFNPYTNVAENIYAKTKIYLMQSTGLRDERGIDIYEGDIVRVTDDDERTDFSDGGIGTVCGSEELYMWYIDGEVQNGLFDINQSYYIEVLGNIYENPELLEVSEW